MTKVKMEHARQKRKRERTHHIFTFTNASTLTERIFGLQNTELRKYINSKQRTMRISNIYQGLLGLVALVGVTAFAPQKSAQLFGVFDRSRNVVGRGSSSLLSSVVEAPTAEAATGSTTANIR